MTERHHDPELHALRSGDEEAFQSLVARLHGPMLRLVMGHVRDRDIAEDVVQDSWLIVLKNLDRFPAEGSPVSSASNPGRGAKLASRHTFRLNQAGSSGG